MGKLTLILGGARSGKSTFAQELASHCRGLVTYIATAQALDPEMQNRIQKHQSERPQNWQTLELPQNIASNITGNPDVIILDCLTLLVSNILLAECGQEDEPNEQRSSAALEKEISTLLDRIRSSHTQWFVVSNEVGLGLVPPYPLGRIYRDELGWANQRFASQADQVFLLVAGIPIPVHPYKNILDME